MSASTSAERRNPGEPVSGNGTLGSDAGAAPAQRPAVRRATPANSAVAIALKELVHELADPLGLIMLTAERALRRQRVPDVAEALDQIRQETMRASRIMHGALERAARHKELKAVGNLNALTRRAVALARRYCDAWTPHRPQWALKLTAPAPRVEMHPVAIEQVVVNLIKNAVESRREQLRIAVSTATTTELAEVIVADNGVGIPASTLPMVFEKFVSTKHGTTGRGLGLSICNEIVTDHGGRILVASEVGRGSIFTVQLPLARVRQAGL